MENLEHPAPAQESGIVPIKPASLRDKLRPWRALSIAAASLWVFWPTLHGDWLRDDSLYLPGNPLLHDPARLWKIWFAPGSFIEYYPIEATVQWIQWQLWHNETLGYHVTNVVLHIINALLVWRLLDKFGLRLAWLGGLLFAIHPAQVESVAWISEFKNTLSLPPFLLAMCAWIDYEEQGKRRDYCVALGLFLAAMLCKITMVLFPVVILLYAWWKRGRIGWKDLQAGAPFFVISLVLGAATMLAGTWFLELHHLPPVGTLSGGFFSRMALVGLIGSFYFSKAVLPVDLSPLYPQWGVDPPSLWQFLPWPILGGAIYWLWSKRQSWGRHVLLGLGFFFINLAPFLGFITVSYMSFTWAMDHLLYLPLIGIIGLAVAGWEQVAAWFSPLLRPYGIGTVMATVALLAWESHSYAGIFSSEETLWTYTIQRYPDLSFFRFNLGRVLQDQDRLTEAIEQYTEVLRMNPGYAEAHNNLGLALAGTGRVPEALQHYDEALRLNPRYAEAYGNRGNLKAALGNLDGALADFDQALKFKPGLIGAWYSRGGIKLARGDGDGALSDLEEVYQFDPRDVHADYAHLLIWIDRIQQNQKAGASQELSAALATNWNGAPEDWVTTIARFLLGQIGETDFLAAAASSDPDKDREQHSEGWYFAGMKRLLDGDKAAAIADFRRCAAIDDKKSTQYMLAGAELKALAASP